MAGGKQQMKTIFPNPKDIEHKWYLIDAEGKRLGRLAVRIADIVRGKTKPTFTPNGDFGDFVIVINADKVQVTGRKKTDKLYHRYSGYPGGLTTETFAKVIKRKPTFPLEHAIKGMLPKGPLGRRLFTNVKVYAGSSHPHEAQKPEKLD
jgi:large subunit ribosomal protein L13